MLQVSKIGCIQFLLSGGIVPFKIISTIPPKKLTIGTVLSTNLCIALSLGVLVHLQPFDGTSGPGLGYTCKGVPPDYAIVNNATRAGSVGEALF